MICLFNEVAEGNFTPTDISFQGIEAINGILTENPSALDYFKLYFTDTLINPIVTDTNRYGEQFIEKERKNLKRYPIVHHWVPTHHDEICALLGIWTLMGIIYKPRVTMYWSNDELLCTPIFKSLMTRNTFLLLVKLLHFADNTNCDANNPNRDRLFKIREVCQMIHNRCGAVYYPCEDLSVDGSLVPFKGRLFFKQYIRTKRSRFGIKLYELCTHNDIFRIYYLSWKYCRWFDKPRGEQLASNRKHSPNTP